MARKISGPITVPNEAAEHLSFEAYLSEALSRWEEYLPIESWKKGLRLAASRFELSLEFWNWRSWDLFEWTVRCRLKEDRLVFSSSRFSFRVQPLVHSYFWEEDVEKKSEIEDRLRTHLLENLPPELLRRTHSEEARYYFILEPEGPDAPLVERIYRSAYPPEEAAMGKEEVHLLHKIHSMGLSYLTSNGVRGHGDLDFFHLWIHLSVLLHLSQNLPHKPLVPKVRFGLSLVDWRRFLEELAFYLPRGNWRRLDIGRYDFRFLIFGEPLFLVIECPRGSSLESRLSNPGVQVLPPRTNTLFSYSFGWRI